MIKSSDSHTVSYRTLKPPLLFTLCTEMCICPGIQLAYPMHRNEQLSQNPACLPYAQKCASVPESSLFTLCTEMCPGIQLVYCMHRNVHGSQNPACLPNKSVQESSLFTLCTEMCICPRIQLVYPINLSRNPACLPYAQKLSLIHI